MTLLIYGVLFCRYKDYREPPWSENKYDISKDFWAVLAARLAFVIVFQVGYTAGTFYRRKKKNYRYFFSYIRQATFGNKLLDQRKYLLSQIKFPILIHPLPPSSQAQKYPQWKNSAPGIPWMGLMQKQLKDLSEQQSTRLLLNRSHQFLQ